MTFAKTIYAAIFLITLWFGLTPFNFLSANDIALVASGEAWAFNASPATNVTADGPRLSSEDSRQGLAFTLDELDLSGATGMSIAIDARSLKRPHGLGVILQLHDGLPQPPLIVAQWIDHLAIRSRRLAKAEARPYAEIGLHNCLVANQPISLLISSGSDGTRIYIDGELAATKAWFTLIDPSGDFRGRLAVGNDATGTQPWNGQLSRLRVYDRPIEPGDLDTDSVPPTIDYRFDQPPGEPLPNAAESRFSLRAPQRFRPLDRVWLAPVKLERIREERLTSDISINLIGFMPCGVALALIAMGRNYRFLKAYAFAASLSLGFSLAIETAQAFLPTRDSSLLDVLCNGAGGAVAAAVLLIVVRFILGPWRFRPA